MDQDFGEGLRHGSFVLSGRDVFGWDEFPGRLPWADEFEPFGLWDRGVKAPWAGWTVDVGEYMTLAAATVPKCDPNYK